MYIMSDWLHLRTYNVARSHEDKNIFADANKVKHTFVQVTASYYIRSFNENINEKFSCNMSSIKTQKRQNKHRDIHDASHKTHACNDSQCTVYDYNEQTEAMITLYQI